MAPITKYEIEDVGIDHAQYFQGRSTVHTDWTSVYVGAGVDPLDAYDQAIYQVAEDGWDVDIINLQERALYHYATKMANEKEGRYAIDELILYSRFSYEDMHAEDCPAKNQEDGECDGMCEYNYYIAIWVR